ncbi:MAG: glycine cleavage system protein H [Thermoanaerobaculia bacterium]|nr:glycine cleavage system protein H [Thermoanaerobaculia bacterium]
MNETELLSPYTAKALEYVLAISYLLLFIPFWRFVQGEAVPLHALGFGWFQVPNGVHLHAGHTWARPEGGDVEVGLDDFAHKLVGPLDAVRFPEIGAPVRQGQKAFTIVAGGQPLDVLSPVDGHVVALNEAVRAHPADAQRDPYGAGWLMKVEPRWLTGNLKNLFSGEAARRFLDTAAGKLAQRLTPQLGVVLQDGGTPVHGIARALDEDHWDELARLFLEGK